MRALEFVVKIIVWFFLFFAISLCWIGAEYVFEGAVHSSTVDAYVAGLLALSAIREIDHFDAKVGGIRAID